MLARGVQSDVFQIFTSSVGTSMFFLVDFCQSQQSYSAVSQPSTSSIFLQQNFVFILVFWICNESKISCDVTGNIGKLVWLQILFFAGDLPETFQFPPLEIFSKQISRLPASMQNWKQSRLRVWFTFFVLDKNIEVPRQEAKIWNTSDSTSLYKS